MSQARPLRLIAALSIFALQLPLDEVVESLRAVAIEQVDRVLHWTHSHCPPRQEHPILKRDVMHEEQTEGTPLYWEMVADAWWLQQNEAKWALINGGAQAAADWRVAALKDPKQRALQYQPPLEPLDEEQAEAHETALSPYQGLLRRWEGPSLGLASLALWGEASAEQTSIRPQRFYTITSAQLNRGSQPRNLDP